MTNKKISTNIFLNSYQQPENKLTYNFFAVLEILNSRILIDFLINKQTADKPIFDIKPLYGGGETNPDGSLTIKLVGGTEKIHDQRKLILQPLNF